MVKKGDTVKDFLQKVKKQLIPEFRELRWVPQCCRGALQLWEGCLNAFNDTYTDNDNGNRLLDSQSASHAVVHRAQLRPLQARSS